MWKVNIYLETDSVQPASHERKYGYVLSTLSKGEEKTREGFGKVEGTYHQTILRALCEALNRVVVPCEITVNSRNAYVLANLIKRKKMMASDFKDAKGNDIRNAELWKQVCKEIATHEVDVKLGQHEYTEWLLAEMRKR